jgi:hypothetical protein
MVSLVTILSGLEPPELTINKSSFISNIKSTDEVLVIELGLLHYVITVIGADNAGTKLLSRAGISTWRPCIGESRHASE